MDKDTVTWALDKKLTGNQWDVLGALSVGHLEIFDIIRVTGLKRHRVEESLRELHKMCRGKGDIDIKLINLLLLIPLSPARNVQQTEKVRKIAPNVQTMVMLYRWLERPLSTNRKEWAASKVIYELAYESCDRNQDQALRLLGDIFAVEVANGTGKSSIFPALYFQRVVGTYLTLLPKKPKLISEQEELTGIRQVWNRTTRKWTQLPKLSKPPTENT